MTDPDQDDELLALYTIADNQLVHIASYHTRINTIMRQFRWATLIHGDGWYFREPYLRRVELALLGDNIRMANIDGTPTPLTIERADHNDKAATHATLTELRAAQAAAEANPTATARARAACRQAYVDALRAKHEQ